jgi:hypothetical protein
MRRMARVRKGLEEWMRCYAGIRERIDSHRRFWSIG